MAGRDGDATRGERRALRREALGGMPSPLVAVLLGLAGFAVVAAIMLVGVDRGPRCADRPLLVPRLTDADESCSRLFITSKEGAVWLMALGVQGATWGVGSAPLFAGLAAWWRQREPREDGPVREIAATGAAGALLVLGPLVSVFFAPLDSPLHGHTQTIRIVTGLGAVVAAASFASLAILDLSARRMRTAAQDHDESPIGGVAADYLGLRRALDGLLALMAAFVTMAVLTAGLLMRALETNVDKSRYSPELMWPYALYLVGVLVLVYVPTHLRLRATGEKIRDDRFPACLPGEPGYDDSKKHREEMDALLGLREGPATKLKSSLVILTPLLGTLAATVLGT